MKNVFAKYLHVGLKMTVDDWWNLSNFLVIASLVIGVIATGGTVWTSKIKDKESTKEIAKLNKDNLTLQQSNLELLKSIETLRAKNIDLEVAVSPRILEQALTAEKLKPYAGINFKVISPPDYEPKRTAGQIRFMLSSAGWIRFTSPLSHNYPFFDGVVVHTNGSQHIREAADVLISVFNDNGIKARTGFPIFDLAPEGILIIVGGKPLPESMELKPENIPANKNGVKSWGNILEE